MLRKRFLPLFVLLAVLLVPITAWGGVVYTVVDDNYTSGSMGSVPVLSSGIPGTPNKNVVTNLGGDHKIHGFRDEGNDLRVLLSQYTYSKPDTLWIYNPLVGYNKPLKETTWSTFSNSRGVVALGRYLYAVDYDNAKVTRVDMKDNAYTASGNVFSYTEVEAGYTAHGEGIVRIGDYLYILFSEEDEGWPAQYNNGKVVKLDADLKEIASASVGKNALSIKAHGGMVYVVSNGGAQKYGDGFNPESMIQRVNPITMAVETLVQANGSIGNLPPGWKSDFRDLAFDKHGNVYVFAGAYNTFWEFDSRIFKTTLPKLLAGDIGEVYRDTTGPGYQWGFKYDAVDDILWCAAGDRLKAFKGTDTWEFDAAALGGNFYSFAVVDAPANPTPGESGGSSGCNSAGFPAIFLLALLPLLFLHTKRGRA